MDKIQIDYVSVNEIVPYENNPRHNNKAVDIVAKSIKEFGFKVPLILDDKNVIVAGHTRLKAALKIGLKEVPVIYASGLSDAQIKAFRIMDNKSSEYATWDMELLKSEFEELQNLDYDLDLTGFKESEINRLLAEDSEPNKGNTAPKYQINQGDMYQLGKHKIICEDSTKPETYQRLLGNEKIAMVYTDPPYGVSYKGVNNPNGRDWEVIEGDNMRGDELYQMLYGAFKSLEPYLVKKGALYVFHASANQNLFEKALNNAGFKVRQQLIWQKHHVLGHSHYHWAHEPIFYCSRLTEDPIFYGDRIDKTVLNKVDPDKMSEKQLRDFVKEMQKESTVWIFNKDNTQSYIHPTQKPVNMAERAIINSSKPFEIVLDAFLGSGSTLMACDQQDRKCYGIELDPVFVSHIIERWENSTGNRGVKL